MNAERYLAFLLINLPDAKPASGSQEVVCKCQYCNDNGDHHHMYVSVPKTDNEPSLFNCFKCGTKGMVTYQKLAEWGIFDTDMALELANHNKSVMKNPLNYKYFDAAIYRLTNAFIRDAEMSKIKLNYINDRLGQNFTYQDMISNKIVLNVNDILVSNNITTITRSLNFVNELNRSFMGFISYDNAFINLRKVNDKSWIDERYINYNIFGKEDNTMKYYINPGAIDICNPNPIKVHMAEGPFDILSVKYNLRREFEQSVYAAVTGNAYKGLLRNIIVNLKLMNLEIHLYADNDTNPKTFKINLSIINDLIDFLRPYNYPMYIHRNSIGKDMGVRRDQINEVVERVL